MGGEERREWRRRLADWLTDSEGTLQRAQAQLRREDTPAARAAYARAKEDADAAQWAALEELRRMQREHAELGSTA